MRIGGVVLAVLTGLALGCVARPVHQRAWVEVETPNFTIWSCRSQARTLELARDLELFRSVAAFVIGTELPASPVPTYVYAFDPLSYRPFSFPQAAGYFDQSMRDNKIVLGASRGARIDPTEVIQHEYVHFLLENHGRFVYPRWYHEGFAQFLAASRVRGDTVVLGSPPSQGFPPFSDWIPLEDLLEGRDGRAFYYQSWAFVHYLNFGREQDASDSTRQQLTRYFRAREQGRSVAEAVQEGFGASVDELDADLGRYVRAERFPGYVVDMNKLDLGAAPRVRRLEPGEVAVHLGALSLHLGRYDDALFHFEEGMRLRPTDARGRVGAGAAKHGLGRDAEAEAELRAAVEAAPDDPLAHLELANFLSARAAAAEGPAERARLATAARRAYVASWKLDDRIPETYARYGATFLLEGQDPGRGLDTLKRAHELLPSSVEIRVDLARLALAMGHPEEARRLALSAAVTDHKRHDEALERILAETEAAP